MVWYDGKCYPPTWAAYGGRVMISGHYAIDYTA